MKKSLLPDVLASLLVLLFFYAAFSKYADLSGGFEREMLKQPFPEWMGKLFAKIIPPIEIITGILLMPERTRKWGFYASFTLMSLFTIYTGTVLLGFFPFKPCSCGGVISLLTWEQHLVFNLFFTGVALWGILLKRRERKRKSESELRFT